MLKTKMKKLLTAAAITSVFAVAPLSAQADEQAAMTSVEVGKKLAFDRSQGNCLACHAIQGGELAGTIGPALIAMKLRYPDRQKLFDKIWGKPETQVPNSMMPPFGQNGILTDKQINEIVDFIYTL